MIKSLFTFAQLLPLVPCFLVLICLVGNEYPASQQQVTAPNPIAEVR